MVIINADYQNFNQSICYNIVYYQYRSINMQHNNKPQPVLSQAEITQINSKFQKYNPKYPLGSLIPLKQMNFLEYFMLPQQNQFDYVYRPGDDSFFMLSVLKQQSKHWQNLEVLAEVGSGSGIISAHVSNWLREQHRSPLIHVSIDINLDASLLSQKYYEKYNLPICQINTSLFKNTIFSNQQAKTETEKNPNNINNNKSNSCPLATLKPQIILFNPPYIPVQQQQIQNQHKYLVQKLKYIRQNKQCIRNRQQNLIAYSYMGGVDGLQITRKLLKCLNWDCSVYLIVMGQEGFVQLKEEISHPQFWIMGAKGELELMQYMKYQNQDLFLVQVKVITINQQLGAKQKQINGIKNA